MVADHVIVELFFAATGGGGGTESSDLGDDTDPPLPTLPESVLFFTELYAFVVILKLLFGKLFVFHVHHTTPLETPTGWPLFFY